MKKILQLGALALVVSIPYSCSREDELTTESSRVQSNNKIGDTNKNVIDSVSPSPVSPLYTPTQNGNFVVVKLATGQDYIMWRFENKWRHVVSPTTWFGLFRSNYVRYSFSSFIEMQNSTGIPVVNPLYPDNDLRQDNYTQKIYLREGNLLRWIPNRTTYDVYQFNDNAIRKINGTAGYTIGSNIQF